MMMIDSFQVVRCTLGVALLAAVVAGTVDARPAGRGRSQNVQLVHVSGGLLTVNVHEVPLSTLLEEIARHGGLALEGQASLAGRITVQFRQIRLEDGLRSILQGQSYALEYSLKTRDRSDIARVPTRLRVFGKAGGSRASSGPVEREAQASLGRLRVDLPRVRAVLGGADDVWDKWDAIAALAESEHSAVALPLLRVALADQDEDMRLAAVEALAALGGDGAAAALEIALRDQ